MRKIAVSLVVLLALASVFVRVQPRGAATIFRRGQQVTPRTHPLYLRPFVFDSQCRAATAGDRRGSGDRAATAIAQGMAAVRPASVSVRIDLPPGFERLRIVPDVGQRAAHARPVIFIGLDGADWQLLDDYVQSGAMPALKR